MWLEWIDEYDEREDSENDDEKCDVMKWDESENKKRREWYDEYKRKWRNEGSEEWHRVESVSEEGWKWECIEMEWGLREKHNGDIEWMKGSDSWCD